MLSLPAANWWRLFGWLTVPGFLLASLVLSALAGLACFTLLEKPLTEALKPRPARARQALQDA